jgi:hypothetical protein
MSINTISKNSIDTITKMPVPSVTKKEKPNFIEHKPVINKKQKRVSFDLTKNTTFFYESEDSIERRMEIKRPLKENIKIIKETIIMPMQFDIHHEQETRMFDYKEIRHFWERLCK